jgi:hypothetical protein
MTSEFYIRVQDKHISIFECKIIDPYNVVWNDCYKGTHIRKYINEIFCIVCKEKPTKINIIPSYNFKYYFSHAYCDKHVQGYSSCRFVHVSDVNTEKFQNYMEGVFLIDE